LKRSYKQFDVSSIKGLSAAEAKARLLKEGYNEIPSAKKRSIFAITFDVVREPMFILLLFCGSVYLLLGDVKEAMMLLGFVFVVIGITLYQERKTERALEALRDLSSPRALVIRDGTEMRIAGREVVREDVIVVSEGDRVPADAVVINCFNLSVDESLLTGESVPVLKIAGDVSAQISRPGGDGLPFIYSGTLVVQGMGIAVVRSIGINTEFGKIGKALKNIVHEDTNLQKETGVLVKNLALIGLFLCSLVVIMYGFTVGNWLNGFLAGLTLAMSILPEEFPMILTIFLALGAWRISRHNVLTRAMPAVESLGSATVLCADKTGTITQNKMAVSKLFASGEFFDVPAAGDGNLPEKFHQLVEFSVLASHKDPFDPVEKAFKVLGERYLQFTEHMHNNWNLVQQYPLSSGLFAISHVWHSPDGEDYVVATKGAPEAVMELCHLKGEEIISVSDKITAMASEGLRVLAVARATFKKKNLPSEQHAFDLEFLGLIGLADPVRPGIKESISECYSAGIRVIMITGDYPGTAKSIARQIGLKHEDVITGPELDKMGTGELRQRIGKANIFARVVPEQKLRIVEALKENGELVAMTGDGVNDAPALKAANIGVAMGGRGTDVAREASEIVLLDDDFSSIVGAVRQGRRIFDNIKKAMTYTFAVHVPIAGMSLAPILFGWPLVLFPVHIVFMELIIDPACSIVFESEEPEKDIMKRPPRRPDEHIFGREEVLISFFQGFIVFLFVFFIHALAIGWGLTDREARAMSFSTLMIANLSLIMINRSTSKTLIETIFSKNTALWAVGAFALSLLALALNVPVVEDLFRFSGIGLNRFLLCVAAGFLSVLWTEALKYFRRRQAARLKS